MEHGVEPPGRVFVFGSANQDHVLAVEVFPRSGETVMSLAYDSGLGGKGANQAVAAAAADGLVTFVGAVGTDEQGNDVLTNLQDHGVDTRFISQRTEPTGLAVVLVDKAGSNEIVVAPGANAALGSEAVDLALQVITPNDVVVVQCEIPVARIEQVIRGGAERGALVIVNLAPFTVIDAAVFEDISLLIVNKSEALALAGSDAPETELASAVAAGTGCSCIVTLGENGSTYSGPGGDGGIHVAAGAVERVIDTTGAGDVYVGTLAASLARRDDTVTSMRAASAAAARSVSTLGAQGRTSQPSRETVA
ncbi:PfkB family carbohydrate kinase [Pseudarthrobacter phenanthrenivorans]|uniref:PfkB family carbohydrate kinase n=1 Tax=Pseudarthrobacter phenanthrenivorans TaxID=361575 RepID=UPI00344EACC3